MLSRPYRNAQKRMYYKAAAQQASPSKTQKNVCNSKHVILVKALKSVPFGTDRRLHCRIPEIARTHSATSSQKLPIVAHQSATSEPSIQKGSLFVESNLAAGKMREWTGKNGTVITGELVSQDDRNITILTDKGETIHTHRQSLSVADQDHMESTEHKELQEKFERLRLNAESGDVNAMALLGHYYSEGMGVRTCSHGEEERRIKCRRLRV